MGMPGLIEAEFITKSNDAFHSISNNVRKESGNVDAKRVFNLWDNWVKDDIKKRLVYGQRKKEC